jgi:hypothetical protein
MTLLTNDSLSSVRSARWFARAVFCTKSGGTRGGETRLGRQTRHGEWRHRGQDEKGEQRPKGQREMLP